MLHGHHGNFLFLSLPNCLLQARPICHTVIVRFVQLQLTQERDLPHTTQQRAIHIKLWAALTLKFYIKEGAQNIVPLQPAGREFENHAVDCCGVKLKAGFVCGSDYPIHTLLQWGLVLLAYQWELPLLKSLPFKMFKGADSWFLGSQLIR